MDTVKTAKEVFECEIKALHYVSDHINSQFDAVVQLILKCTGRVIVCGMGKSGLVGKKISASLSSTGTASFFVHPAEAIHGDLGMICSGDVFIGISYSGETSELVNILPYLHDTDVPIVAMTSNANSTLGKASRFFLDVSIPEEACPLRLAPTSSSTAALVMGDALTISLMNIKGFTAEHFARFHPGGELGRKLTSTIRQEMVRELPTVKPSYEFMQVLKAITDGGLGLCLVMRDDRLSGIITDGDVRRSMNKGLKYIRTCTASSMMTGFPIAIDINESMSYAISLMELKSINRLLVVDNGVPVGILKK